jgi:hypothetical protein
MSTVSLSIGADYLAAIAVGHPPEGPDIPGQPQSTVALGRSSALAEEDARCRMPGQSPAEIVAPHGPTYRLLSMPQRRL